MQRAVGTFDATLDLAGAKNLYIQLAQRTAKLSDPLTVFGVSLGRVKHRVLVRIEGDRTAMLMQMAFQSLEITEPTLGLHKPQLHQGAGRVNDEDEQSAGWNGVFKPAVI